MFRLGTHTSIAGGPELAFARSADVGGNTLQIFAKSPRGWLFPSYTPQQVALGRDERNRTGQIGGLIHSNYLINLSKPTEAITQELASLVHDFSVADAFGYEAVNVHIGKMKGFTRDEAMSSMRKNLDVLFHRLRQQQLDRVQFLRENTAGQGSEIGSTLEEIGYFYRTYLFDLPVKFCFDTAHWWGGGVDVRDWTGVVAQLDEQIGLDQVYCFHLNDAKVPLGSKLDRHASLGRGFIGRKALVPIVQWAAKNNTALYIETPESDLWTDEITKVKQIVAGELGWIDEFDRAYGTTQSLKKFVGVTQDSLF